MELEDIRDQIITAAVPHVVFDGWTLRTLRAGAVDASLNAAVVAQAFPDGVATAVVHFFALGDRQMSESLAEKFTVHQKLRERLAIALRCRLEIWPVDRDVVRRALAVLALPSHATTAAKCAFDTADALWRTVGDTAMDFSYYTKRGLLSGLYLATLLYWLGDTSEGSKDTWEFLDRRIANMNELMALRTRIELGLSYIPNPVRIFRPKQRGGRRMVLDDSVL